MAIIEYVLIITLGVTAGWLFYSATRQRQLQQQVENAFYQLLETQDSYISLIQLAVTAKVEPQIAQQYLERQVKFLGAIPEVDADGNTLYRFPKLHLQLSKE